MDLNSKVFVVYGGISTEREISLKSGAAVAEALREYGYTDVTLFDITADNCSELLSEKPDMVYIALHGEGGEDGKIQGMLDWAGIPYTGPGVASSAVCLNKIFTKQVLTAAEIPTAGYIAKQNVRPSDRPALLERIKKELGFPMVLKAPSQGSSIGVVIVHDEKEFDEAAAEVFKYGEDILAEQFLDGTEITVPIIGNDELTVLPEIEITSENEFYDYQSKYTEGMCHHIIPARISEEDREAAKKIAKRAYRALGCTGISRVDMIVDKKYGPMVLEINTSPGMTSMSLVPDSGRAAGISFPELTSRILTYGYETER